MLRKCCVPSISTTFAHKLLKLNFDKKKKKTSLKGEDLDFGYIRQVQLN